MSQDQLIKLAEELFYVYSLVNSDIRPMNCLSTRTNQVLEFEKYIWHVNWRVIHKYCPEFEKGNMKDFRKTVSKMTALYLDENIKTLALY